MATKITAKPNTQVKAPDSIRSLERQFGEVNQYMIDQMAKSFRNQVLLELNKSTIDKFADAQTGNFANVYLKLADKAKRKLLRRFSNDRLSKISKKYTGQADKRNAKQFYENVESKVGISQKQLEATEGLTFTINAYQAETSQWIQKLRDETLQQWIAGTLRMMAEGTGLEEILSQFDDMTEKRKNHAKMVARTQIATFNSLTSKARAQNLGIEKAVWVTAQDERVRGNPGGKYPNAHPSHYWADGKEFDLSKGLKFPNGDTLLPGTSYNCRCTYRMILPED